MSPKELTVDEKKRIYEAESFLVNHLERKLTKNELAKKAALSIVKLNDGFNKLFGMGVSRYIKESRLRTGLFLLQHTDKPIKEIAAIIGYGHTKNFLIAFKKHFKKTPGSIPRPAY
jgi:transcriptional regulator GlxA family with amidase domain